LGDGTENNIRLRFILANEKRQGQKGKKTEVKCGGETQ